MELTSPRIRVVQFLHPGSEPIVSGQVKAWNRGEHRRGFFRVAGRYVTGCEVGQVVKTATVGIWAEWEAEAAVASRSSTRVGGFPSLVLDPYYVVPRSFAGLQNTDPFVFGGPFYYSCCKQFRKSTGRKTSLASLQRGSVILFGSHRGGGFVLDTVFVVAGFVDYDVTRPDETEGAVVSAKFAKLNPAFVQATLNPLAAATTTTCNDLVDDSDFVDEDEVAASCAPACAAVPLQLRLYVGASYEEPVDGMFSYSPCALQDTRPEGFPRPMIASEAINVAMTQGFRLGPVLELNEATKLWTEVARQVIDSGLQLGVAFAAPPARDK